MSIATLPPGHTYLERLDELAAVAGEPAWLAERRAAAARCFAELGFPTRKHEDWNAIPATPITDGQFEIAPDSTDAVTAEQLAPFKIPGLDAYELVFVDGRLAPQLSSAGELPSGLFAGNLRSQLDADLKLEEHLCAYATGVPASGRTTIHDGAQPDDAFAALNTSLWSDGGLVAVDHGVEVDKPVHLLFVSTGRDGQASFPRNLFIVGRGAKVTVVQDYVSLADGKSLTCAVSEAVVADEGSLDHYLLQRESTSAYHVNHLRAEQQAKSNVSSHALMLGGAISRSLMNPVFRGPHSEGTLSGIYVPRGTQQVSNQMRVDHDAPDCASRQYYRGILHDNARAAFSGRIVVQKVAQRTDAVQANENMLLSDTAQADSRPQLEIYADDVKCTHGATIGHVDEGALFYLMARGLPREIARGALIHAFCLEVLERMPLEPVRELVEREVLARLQLDELLQVLN